MPTFPFQFPEGYFSGASSILPVIPEVFPSTFDVFGNTSMFNPGSPATSTPPITFNTGPGATFLPGTSANGIISTTTDPVNSVITIRTDPSLISNYTEILERISSGFQNAVELIAQRDNQSLTSLGQVESFTVMSNPSNATILVDGVSTSLTTSNTITIDFNVKSQYLVQVIKNGYQVHGGIRVSTLAPGGLKLMVSYIDSVDPGRVLSSQIFNSGFKPVLNFNLSLTVPTPSNVNRTILFESNVTRATHVILNGEPFNISNTFLLSSGNTIELQPAEIQGFRFVRWVWGNDTDLLQIINSEINVLNRELSVLLESNGDPNLINDKQIRLNQLQSDLNLFIESQDDFISTSTDHTLNLQVPDNLIVSVEYDAIGTIEDGAKILSLPDELVIEVEETATSKLILIPYASANTDRIELSTAFTQKIVDVTDVGTVELDFFSDFHGEFKNYQVVLVPINNDLGPGVASVVIIKFLKKLVLPVILEVVYPSVINIPSFSNNSYQVVIVYKSANAATVLFDLAPNEPSSPKVPVQVPASGILSFNFNELELAYGIHYFTMVPQGIDGTNGEIVPISITFNEPEKPIDRNAAISKFREIYNDTLLKSINERYTEVRDDNVVLTNVINIGSDQQFLIADWISDDITFENDNNDIEKNGSVILKMYEPLPQSITPNDLIWISREISPPVVRQITLVSGSDQSCNILKPANFNVELNGDTLLDTGFNNLEELISSGSLTSQDLVDKYINKIGIDLDTLGIDYTDYTNFSHFGSAKERLSNFQYKLQLAESYDVNVNTIEASGASLNSPTVQLELTDWKTKKTRLISTFDSYEKHLYTNTGSTTWPKEIGDGTVNQNTTSSEAIAWFNSQSAVANSYDTNNPDYVNNNLPNHITDDTTNAEFTLFTSMVGHHYDILWAYTKAFENVKKVENKRTDGIHDKFLPEMLSSLGWNVRSSIATKDLWNLAFGFDNDGNLISSSSSEDYQFQIWRRILNNLPYLLKNKGTKRGIKSLINLYGVPSSILSIREYGGPVNVEGVESEYIFENNTFGLNFTTSSNLIVPWNIATASRKPDAVEFHFKLNGSDDYTAINAESWSLAFEKGTGSFGQVNFAVSGSGSITSTITSSQLPIYDDDFYSILLNRSSGSTGIDTFTMFVKKSDGISIVQKFSGSIAVPGPVIAGVTSSGWDSTSSLEVGNFAGMLDEFRIWNYPLNESAFDQHVLFRESFAGNYISSSTENLILRLSFESASNLGAIDPSFISNESPITSYALQVSASGFDSLTAFPHNFEVLNRDNVIKLPIIGCSLPANNKVRLETQELISDLNFKSRATKKSFDQSPVDTNRIGVFLSPTDAVNIDILKSFGDFNFSNLIGDPQDRYNDEYKDLTKIRDYYWNRFDAPVDFWDYIKLIKSFDRSMFEHIKEMIPARATLTKGLLIEPNILERSKIRQNRPTGSRPQYDQTIDANENHIQTGNTISILGVLDAQEYIDLPFENVGFDARITYNLTESVSGQSTILQSVIQSETQPTASGEKLGWSITIDADLREPKIITTVDIFSRAIVGFDEGLDEGYGMFAIDGYTELLSLVDGKIIGKRILVRKVTETITDLIPIRENTSDPASLEVFTEVPRSIDKLSTMELTDANHPFTASFKLIGVGVNGYLPNHYRFVKDTTTGLENSFYKGSKQTSATTLDGSPPFETFITNPNTLKVSKTGRDKTEPILEVD